MHHATQLKRHNLNISHSESNKKDVAVLYETKQRGTERNGTGHTNILPELEISEFIQEL